MILYRKGGPLRVRRSAAPEAPLWAATAILPYGARRAAPVAVDYLAQRATAADKLEVTVAEHVSDALDRMAVPAPPVLVDATESAELVFRRGEECAAWCAAHGLATTHLVSTHSALPQRAHERSAVAIAAWPVDWTRLTNLFGEARTRELRWGVLVPVMYPVTTELEALTRLADAAAAHGARFLAGMAVDVDATARQAFAQSLSLAADDDRYALLFHGNVDPVHLATERHLAALAAERQLADFVTPPLWEERSNWNASVLLTLVASRMIAMELDLDLAGTIARSARAVAELDKPLTRIAESASLSIIGGVDDTSTELLTEWIAGAEPSFAEFVNEQWRVRRDSY